MAQRAYVLRPLLQMLQEGVFHLACYVLAECFILFSVGHWIEISSSRFLRTILYNTLSPFQPYADRVRD